MQNGFIELLIIFSIVCGPTKALALFAAKTSQSSVARRKAIAIEAVLVSTVILFTFALFGQAIIKFMHVTVPALEIAGGIILFVFAIGLVLGNGHDEDGGAGDNIAVYPMAMPMLASPQAIVALVVVMARSPEWSQKGVALAALGTQMVINLAVLLVVAVTMKAPKEGEVKKGGIGEVVLRVVAILLCGFAVELMLLGLRDLGIIPRTLTAH